MRVSRQPHGVVPAAANATSLAQLADQPILSRDCELLVLGAGPGGLAAAEAAAAAGCRVILLDERPEPGGQYFKQLAASHRFSRPAAMDRQFASGQALVRRVRDLGVEILSQATAWGAFDGADSTITIGALHDGRALRFQPRQLIVAAGAYERSYPVPGWTLPGVMTTGATQTLGRAYRVAPGSRVLIAGNGPLNLQVACELARGGAAVVAVAEAAPAPGPARLAALWQALRRAPGLMWDGLGYLAALRRRGVPILYRHVLVRAEGAGRVRRAVLARIDDDGRPLPGSEQTFDVDALCLGYGFLPSVEITRLLGCRHGIDPRGGLVVERDENGGTSRPGVFAVGDGAAIGGSRVALAQGALAGVQAARNLGKALEAGAEERRTRAHRQLHGHLAFQQALWRIFEAPPPSDDAIGDPVVVCRCEEVTAGTLRQGVAAGADEIGTLKRLTRAGMGRCQGRYCGPFLARLCAAAGGRPLEDMSYFAPRLPVKPVPAAALASEQPEWNERDQGQPAPPAERPVQLSGRQASGRQDHCEVAVIGAGILGACAALYLAREGIEVIQLERGQPNGQASGANAGSLHVQLLSYDFGARPKGQSQAAAEVLPLQRESARLWPELAAELGRDLEISVTGGLMVAEDERTLTHLRRKVALERSYGTQVEIISARELQDMAPQVSSRMVGAAWCAEEGKINPMLATPAVLDGARAAGARLLKETEVLAIERDGDGFVMTTTRGTVRAAKVLNACGGWAAQVAAMVGCRLPIRANPIHLIVTEPVAPCLSQLLAHAERHLTLKQVANGNLVIGGGWPAELAPETGHPRVLEASLGGNLWVAERVLPALRSVQVIRSWAAMNVNIDGAPILGEAPGVPGFYNAVSVNGLTLGPVIGRLTAEVIRTGRTGRAGVLAPFTLERFA